MFDWLWVWLFRCSIWKRCPHYRKDSYTCNKEGDYFTSMYCGKRRGLL